MTVDGQGFAFLIEIFLVEGNLVFLVLEVCFQETMSMILVQSMTPLQTRASPLRFK